MRKQNLIACFRRPTNENKRFFSKSALKTEGWPGLCTKEQLQLWTSARRTAVGSSRLRLPPPPTPVRPHSPRGRGWPGVRRPGSAELQNRGVERRVQAAARCHYNKKGTRLRGASPERRSKDTLLHPKPQTHALPKHPTSHPRLRSSRLCALAYLQPRSQLDLGQVAFPLSSACALAPTAACLPSARQPNSTGHSQNLMTTPPAPILGHRLCLGQRVLGGQDQTPWKLRIQERLAFPIDPLPLTRAS